MAKLKHYAEDRQRWEKQPGESKPAYEALSEYLRLPYASRDSEGRPGPRSLGLTAEALGKSLSLIKRWSAEWKWGERADAFDVKQRQDEEAAVRQAEREAALRVARRRVTLRDDSWDLFVQARERVAEALKFPLFHETETEVQDVLGGPTTVIHRHPLEEWSPSNIASLARAALALGLVAVDDGKGSLDSMLAKVNAEDLSTEQLQALVNDADPISALFSGGTPETESESGARATQEARSGAAG